MPIIAGRASAAYGAGFGAAVSGVEPWSPEGAYDALASVTLSTATATITFGGIPNGYKHLQIRMLGRSSRSANEGYGVVRFNSDTGSNYSYHAFYGDGSSAAAGGSGSVNYPTLIYFPAASRGASIFGVGVLDVLDYQNTNKNKTIRVLDGYDSNGAGYATLQSGAWYNTAAVSTITITEFNGNNFVEYSQFALYGVK